MTSTGIPLSLYHTTFALNIILIANLILPNWYIKKGIKGPQKPKKKRNGEIKPKNISNLFLKSMMEILWEIIGAKFRGSEMCSIAHKTMIVCIYFLTIY